jgi:hypothetical protein
MTKALTIPSAGGARSKFGPRKAPLRVTRSLLAHDQFMDPLALQQELQALTGGMPVDETVLGLAIREVAASWLGRAAAMPHMTRAVAETYAKMLRGKPREL